MLTRHPSPQVVTSRTYDDRISTIENVRNAGISVCSGGILGLGEEAADRVGLIYEMSHLPEHPESFPVNALVAIPGTPMEGNEVSCIVAAPACLAELTRFVTFAARQHPDHASHHRYGSSGPSYVHHPTSSRSSPLLRVRASHVLPGRCQRHLHGSPHAHHAHQWLGRGQGHA